MPLFVDQTSGTFVKLSSVHGWHKLDEIDKFSKNAQGKLVIHKKNGAQLVIEDAVATAVETVLKKEGKDK